MLSCNSDNKTETTTESDTSTNNANVNVPPADNTGTVTVPDNTRIAFEAKYPNATNVVWVRKNRDVNRSTIVDSMDYQVTYRWNDADYVTWYEWDGDWIVTTSKVTRENLPAAVIKAIDKNYPGYTITEADMENDKNMTMYEVDLEKGTQKITVHFSESGTEHKTKTKMK